MPFSTIFAGTRFGNSYAALNGRRNSGKPSRTRAMFGLISGFAFAIRAARFSYRARICTSALHANILTGTVLVIGAAFNTKAIFASLPIWTLLISETGDLALTHVTFFTVS